MIFISERRIREFVLSLAHSVESDDGLTTGELYRKVRAQWPHLSRKRLNKLLRSCVFCLDLETCQSDPV